MPDWVWLLAIFLALTMGYVAGFTCGTWRTDPEDAPSEEAYLEGIKLNLEVYKELENKKAEITKELEIRKAELEYRKWAQMWAARQKSNNNDSQKTDYNDDSQKTSNNDGPPKIGNNDDPQ